MARRPNAPKNMSTLFNSTTGTLAQIQSKTNSLTLLSSIVRQICPDLPEDAFNITNFVQKTLIIEVKSSVWGQRLQFERNTICQALMVQTQGQFSHIEIKVNPQGHRQIPNQNTYQQNTPQNSSIQSNSIKNQSFQEKKGSAQRISPTTAAHLLKIAKTAPKGLRETLERLAANAANKE